MLRLGARDVEVVRVSVWRNPIGSKPRAANGLVFVADAVFLERARPDVAAVHSRLSRNTRTVWRMQILTNMLPNSNGSAGTGHGTYKFSVFAHDAYQRLLNGFHWWPEPLHQPAGCCTHGLEPGPVIGLPLRAA